MGRSARALAHELAADPGGRFGNSELLKLASGLGSGDLRVEGDKVSASPSGYIDVLVYWRFGVWGAGRCVAGEGGRGLTLCRVGRPYRIVVVFSSLLLCIIFYLYLKYL